ncbi:MAG: phosphate signaling complex protein PhoU [Defluviitaleaceae bacterium]|nr:phosphate signaling complex protein PhoU [Defluviitaleaceae bacterium]
MPRRANYEKDLQEIFDNLILMCRSIESAIEKSIKSLVERDFDLAHEVYNEHRTVDKLEREIEQACLRLLVMEHPMARDFREVTAALKMITDLERIGDQAWDIAEITMQFKSEKYMKKLEHISAMAVIVTQMVKDGVQAYINKDIELARSIYEADDRVDALFNTVTADVIARVKVNPNKVKQEIRFVMIAKYLERIGDHAVNVGEWVEYSITGNHPKNIGGESM